jgi:hypothetical protein
MVWEACEAPGCWAWGYTITRTVPIRQEPRPIGFSATPEMKSVQQIKETDKATDVKKQYFQDE